MKLAKSAVAYYTQVTGNVWSKFYDDLDEALSGNLDEQEGDLWLIHVLMDVIIKNGMSVGDFKMNKDAVKAVFDEEGRKLAGEFFTPVVWAEELHRYMDKEIPNWRDTYNVWENSCYSMDTEIFTKRGWVTYDELRDDDEVYTLNPNTMMAEWSGFHDRFKKPFKGDMIHFSGVGIDYLVTPDHKMFCLQRVNSRNKERTPVSISAEDLFNHYDSLGTTSKINTYKVVTSAECVENYMYDEVEASKVEALNRFENSNYFWYFVGLFIGDGGFFNDSKGHLNAIKFSAKKNRKVEDFKFCFDGLGINYSLYDYRDSADGKASFRITDSCLLDFINTYVGFGFENKRIPFNILSKDNMKWLLYGLIATDGAEIAFTDKSYMPKNSLVYWTANVDLANDIELLGRMLGYHCSKFERVRKSTHSDKMCKEIRISLSGKSTHSLMKSNINKVYYDDFVWDLTTNNDNHIFLVRRDGKEGFSKNCGSGNLIRTARINPDHLFASSLQDDDITLIKNTPELQGCHAFQLDFLHACDDKYNRPFVESLPEELKQIIKNDEPLIFLCNPPYKTGQANATAVGTYMSKDIPYLNNVNFSKPAYDLFYQFCFQIMNIATLYNLTNCYLCVFGPLTWFTGAGANVLLKEFERVFEFKDGMCISAQEFSDTSNSILWGIGATIWKSRGGYQRDRNIQYHKNILLDKKFIAPDGTIGCEGKVLYAPPRKKLSAWVHSEDSSAEKAEFPLMTSHLTFKGGDVFGKVAYKTVRMRSDAWGILMSQDTMTRSSDQSAVMSAPSTIQYEPIVEENFWRAVASYTFRRIYEADWAIAKKDISAPDTNVEGYDLWLKNAIPLFLFEYKSMMASLRNIVNVKELNQPEETQTKITIRNNFFFITPEEVREYCTDPVILKDLEDNPPTEGQLFMYNVIKECEPYWVPEVKQLYDWCKNYVLSTYDLRKSVGYKGSLECWDAGFQQLRSGLWDADKLDADMTKLLVQARDYMRRDISKFGFVSEVQGSDL